MDFDDISEFVEENPGKVTVGMYGVFLVALGFIYKGFLNRVQKKSIQREAEPVLQKWLEDRSERAREIEKKTMEELAEDAIDSIVEGAENRGLVVED